MITHSELHYRIIEGFVNRGYPPSVEALAQELSESSDDVRDTLLTLQGSHGVVLHPNTQEIWIAHPFSAAPTNFWVETERIGCWANCAWCAMGAVTLLGGSAKVTSTLGAESRQVVLHVENGILREAGLFVHFPVPMARAWDNVVYTCSMMLLFESEAQVTGWCRRHSVTRGDVQPLARILEFAQDWYGRHLDRDWVKWSAAAAVALFEKHGLSGPIWQIAPDTTRF